MNLRYYAIPKDNRAISTMQVIEELVKLAKNLAANSGVVQAMGDDKLKLIAAELIT